MNKSFIEIFTGIAVIAFAGYFLINSYTKAELKKDNKGYEVTAKFSNVDGINVGSEIRIAGIKIGEVVKRHIDTKTYQAILTLNVNDNIKIPTDSTAEVSSEGFLGGKFVTLKAGAEDEMLKDQGEIKYTQSSVSLENLIGKMIFSSNNKEKNSDAATPSKNTPESKSSN